MNGKLGAVLVSAVFVAGTALVVRASFSRLPQSVPVTVVGDETERPLEAAIEDFDPEGIVTVLPYDAIQALSSPPLMPADESSLPADERVIGVELEGQARAYPVALLSVHEIVNDEVRGKTFAVTW